MLKHFPGVLDVVQGSAIARFEGISRAHSGKIVRSMQVCIAPVQSPESL